MKYLEATIAEARRTPTPSYGMTVEGYTKRSGAPTSWMIRIKGERRWRRLMIWQSSNAGTTFLRINGEDYVVHDFQLPEPSEPGAKDLPDIDPSDREPDPC